MRKGAHRGPAGPSIEKSLSKVYCQYVPIQSDSKQDMRSGGRTGETEGLKYLRYHERLGDRDRSHRPARVVFVVKGLKEGGQSQRK